MGLQEQPASPKIPVDVTLSGLLTRTRIRGSSVLLRLDITMRILDSRGVHVSRVVEALRAVESREFDGILDFCRDLIAEIRARHESELIRVSASWDELLEFRSPVTGASERVPVSIRALVERGHNSVESLSISIPVITACPNMRELNDGITHTQRGITEVEVRGSKLNVDHTELALLVVRCLTPTHMLLKLESEKRLVARACDDAMFAEDVVRRVALAVASSLRGVAEVRVRHRSLESIHPFDILAEARVCTCAVRTQSKEK